MKSRLLFFILSLLIAVSFSAAVAGDALYLLPRSSPLLKTAGTWQAEIPEARMVKKALRRDPADLNERLQRWMIVELKDGETIRLWR